MGRPDRTTGRVVDVLETMGGWHTVLMLIAEIEARWGPIGRRAVDRAIQGLVESGDIERRQVEVLIQMRNGARPRSVQEVRAA
jgi:hypothetical protein